jgi:hypothetical protein
MPGLDHLDKYVLQLIVLNLPTCPSWVVLASLSRRFYSIIRCIKAFEVDIPLFSTIQPTQLSNLLNTWDGTKTLCALNLSNVNYNISSSLFFLNKVPQPFPQQRLSMLQRIVFNEIHRTELELLFDVAPRLKSVTVLNAVRLSGALKIRDVASSTTNSASSSSSSSSTSSTTTPTPSSNTPQPPSSSGITALRFTNLEKARMNTLVPMVRHAGQHLQVLRLNGSPFVDSTILRHLYTMQNPPQLKELSLAQCQNMGSIDVHTFLMKCGSALEWLDLSFCSGMKDTAFMNDLQPIPEHNGVPAMPLDPTATGFSSSTTNNTSLTPRLPCLKTILFDQCRELGSVLFFNIVDEAPFLNHISLRGANRVELRFMHWHSLDFVEHKDLLRAVYGHERSEYMTKLDVSHTKVSEDFITEATSTLTKLSYLGIEGCRSISLKVRQAVFRGELGKEKRPSMYVHMNDEEEHEQAKARYQQLAATRRRRNRHRHGSVVQVVPVVPVDVDSLKETPQHEEDSDPEKGEEGRTKKRRTQ